jgi:hypothetical protein
MRSSENSVVLVTYENQGGRHDPKVLILLLIRTFNEVADMINCEVAHRVSGVECELSLINVRLHSATCTHDQILIFLFIQGNLAD